MESESAEEQKAKQIAEVFFGTETPPDDPGLWTFIQDFLTMGESNDDGGEKVFDFEIDSGRLYAAFRQSYGIDLATEKMHWWVFLELFRALPDDTMLKKVVEIRTKKPDKNDSPEQRAALMKAKDAFRLSTPNLSALFGD